MDGKTRAVIRKMIEDEGWHRIGIIEEPPDVALWNQEVELMYEDMDGRPRTCNALYVVPMANRPYYKATTGPAEGNRMENLIAWKEQQKEGAE